MNCTVNVQDMCQKEVMEQSAGKNQAALTGLQPGVGVGVGGGEPGALNYKKGD